MSEPKKDVKVYLRPAIHAALKELCAIKHGGAIGMGEYIERLVEQDIGSKAMNAMVLEEAFRRSGITRDEAERASRRGLTSNFGELPP